MIIDHDIGSIQSLFVLDLTVASPLTSTTGVLTLQGTGALVVPVGNNTTERPSSPANGMIRFNNTSSVLEYYNGAWTSVASGSASVSSVAIASDTTGLTVVSGSPITTSGTIHLALSTELVGVAGLTTTGSVVRTGSGTYTTRTDTGTAGNITVTNGDGVAGNPTFNLATVSQGSTGTSLLKFQLDTFGRVINNTAVTTSDITTLVDATYVNVSGDTMSSAANLTFVGGGEVLGLPATPSGNTAAASKAYVDALFQGVTSKSEASYATTSPLNTFTYANGTAGVGATITENSNGALTVDGASPTVGQIILVKNETAGNAPYNGLYTVTATGSAGAPFVLTRVPPMDSGTEFGGAFTFIHQGSINGGAGWICTNGPIVTVGTTAITFVQFSGVGTYTAGTGLTLTGTQFSITSPISTTLGGTGLTTTGTSNQFLAMNTAGTGLEYKTVSAGTGISVTPGAGTLSIANTGVTAIAGTTNQITASAATGSVTLSLPAAVILPGSLTVTTGTSLSTTASITATGSSQGTATALTTTYNIITSASAGTGVILPTASAGLLVTIVNRGANFVNLYPATGATMDGLPANNPIQIPVNGTITLEAASTTSWFTTKAIELSGGGMSVSYGNGSVTYTNTGVTSNVAGTGISLSSGTGSVTITNSGVTSVAGTANQISVSASTGAVTFSLPSAVTIATSLTVSGLPANSFLYSGTAGLLTTTTAPTNGQLLIGSTGTSPVAAALTAGTGISVTNGAGSITINNTGVTSVALSAPSIFTVSGSPVTTTGTLTFSLNTQTTNLVFASPNGSTGAPTFRSLAMADLPIQLYRENPSSPTVPSATGTNAVATGSGSVSALMGGNVHAGGIFATAGDAQSGTYIVRNITTTAAVTELFLDGTTGTQRMVLTNNSLWTFTILIAARRTDAVGGGAGYKFEGVIRKDTTAGSTTLVGAVAKTILGETNVAWDAAVVSDTTNGSLRVNVTGEAAKTIRWVATVITSEVTN
jgi:hypothetical protein